MTFTGWMLLNGFSSEWLQLYTSVCMAWLQRTWLNCVCPSLCQQVIVVGFGPPQPATWSYHARCRLSTYGTRAFSVAGPVCWNSLLDYLKSSDLSINCFRQQLKTFLFCKYWRQSQHYFSALETLLMRSTNLWYLLLPSHTHTVRDLLMY